MMVTYVGYGACTMKLQDVGVPQASPYVYLLFKHLVIDEQLLTSISKENCAYRRRKSLLEHLDRNSRTMPVSDVNLPVSSSAELVVLVDDDVK
jgi:hypothetical protein